MLLRSSTKKVSLAAAATFVAVLAADSSAARAESADRLRGDLRIQAAGCGTANDGSVTAGARCLFGNGLALLFDEGARLAREYGEEAFGPHFRLVGTAAYSPVADNIGLTGDLDIVIPFAGADSSAMERPPDSALFLQQGLTHWQDGSGSLRNDLRYGLAYRFRISDKPDGDVLGLSLLQLHNAERQHRVLVPGIDYSGRWGNGALRYFAPTTGWRSNGPGREERALAGVEFTTGFEITTTLRANAAGYRRESEDGSGRWAGGARLGLGWRPHPWLNLAAGFNRSGDGGGALSLLHRFQDDARKPIEATAVGRAGCGGRRCRAGRFGLVAAGRR